MVEQRRFGSWRQHLAMMVSFHSFIIGDSIKSRNLCKARFSSDVTFDSKPHMSANSGAITDEQIATIADRMAKEFNLSPATQEIAVKNCRRSVSSACLSGNC